MSLEIINSYVLTTGKQTYSDWQGLDTVDTPYVVELTDDAQHSVSFPLETGAWKTVWDDDDDVPVGFRYLHIVASVDMYLQLVSTNTNVIFQLKANEPFTLSDSSLLAAAATTDQSTEPTLEEIDHIRVGNYSGDSGTVRLIVAY